MITDYDMTMFEMGIVTPAMAEAFNQSGAPIAAIEPASGMSIAGLYPQLSEQVVGGDESLGEISVLPGIMGVSGLLAGNIGTPKTAVTAAAKIASVLPSGVSADPGDYSLMAILAGGGTILLGLLRGLVAKYGLSILKLVGSTAVVAKIWSWVSGGESDDKVISIPKGGRTGGRRRRYSIGSNPRMDTLLKVAKRVDNIFVRYDSRMRKFRSRIRGGRTYRQAPSNYYLSPAEKHLMLNRGRR